MWRDKTISVVLPTYNEKDSIQSAIIQFEQTEIVDEILVINNNAAPGTSEEVAATSAREVLERRQGYGYAIQRGLREARGDYIVISEPDGTFLGRDLFKLLAYADDFEVVYGSRTARMFIWRGANMGWFLRWGNWAVAKMMEFLNAATKAPGMDTDWAKDFVLVLAPFAPHMAEELWERLGGGTPTLAYHSWPRYDEMLLTEDTIEIPVQVNGKVRSRVTVAVDAANDAVLGLAKLDEHVARHLEGKEIVKEIVVPGKMVNLVVR